MNGQRLTIPQWIDARHKIAEEVFRGVKRDRFQIGSRPKPAPIVEGRDPVDPWAIRDTHTEFVKTFTETYLDAIYRCDVCGLTSQVADYTPCLTLEERLTRFAEAFREWIELGCKMEEESNG